MYMIEYSIKDCYELQLIDTNCNNCIFMNRDLEKYKKWYEYHKKLDLELFEKEKLKAINDAKLVIETAITQADKNTGLGMLRKADKIKFQFEKYNLLQYGFCTSKNIEVSFIPVTCMIQNSECFKHRK